MLGLLDVVDDVKSFDLQLFADLPDTEDDNPETPDDEDVDLESLLAEAEEDMGDEDEEEGEEENGEDKGEEEGSEPAAKPNNVNPPPPPPIQYQERLFTQADVDRIVQERLARDRKSQAVRELEQLAGMDINAILDYARQNKIAAKAEELGISHEEARRILENEERVARLEEEQCIQAEHNRAIMRAIAYQQAKAKYINDPLVKKYEREIDNFAQGGLVLDFEPAMNFILGEKLRSGELLKEIQAGTEKKTLANLSKRAKAAPEKGTQAGVSASGLTNVEKRIAAALGISPKEYAAQKEALQKKKAK